MDFVFVSVEYPLFFFSERGLLNVPEVLLLLLLLFATRVVTSASGRE